MENFYLTYSITSGKSRNYSIIRAESYDQAHDIAIATIGTKWAFLYTEEQFMGTPSKFGKYPSQIEAFKLTEIPLI